MKARALIAEDEPLLLRALERELGAVWPALDIVARATDGPAAIEQALALRPDVLFLDVQLPGASGLDVAAEVADDWPDPDEPAAAPRPLIVFVTAFDQYAVAAFERAAVDYLLKPITPPRLAAAVARLQERLAQRQPASGAASGADLVRRMQALAEPAAAPGTPAPETIRVIRAAEPTGTRIRMIALPDVVCIEAADKYAQVVTEQGSALVRISLRELMLRLDPAVEFVQVHRALLVNAARIAGAERDETGHYWLTLRGLARPVKVSRAFAHLFRPM